MEGLLDNPVTPIAGLCLLAGLGVSIIARAFKPEWLAGLAAPAVFLLGYYLTYNKIPDFPPAGSVNKIFYIALFGTVIGLVVDLVAPRLPDAPLGRIGLAAVAAVAPAGWIVLPRLADADAGLWALIAAVVPGGGLALWRVASLRSTAPDDALLLAVLALGFAPIALFGGSSTSVGLCVGLFVGFGAMGLVGLVIPRTLSAVGLLGGGAGLLAVVDTVVLITRRADPLALAVLVAVLFAGQIGTRLLLPQGRMGPRVRSLLTGVLAAIPIAAIVAILFLRDDSPF